ncbi:MAG: PQQ-binding-like beta-propeller repeat protein [Propionicimonas sp.]
MNAPPDARPEPAPPTPGPTRPVGWRSATVVALAFGFGLLTTAVALQPPRTPQDSLLPADGSVQAVEVEGEPGQVEWAALRGRQLRGLGALGRLATESVPAGELDATQWWRLGFTVADPPPILGGSGPLVPTTEFVLLRGSEHELSLVGVSLQHLGWVYTDPVPLPASGERQLTGRYTPPGGDPGEHRTRVLASTTGGCRTAEIHSTLGDLEVELGLELCQGRFVRFDIAIPGSGSSSFVAVDRPPTPFQGELTAVPSRPVEGGWQVSSAKLVAADSALGGAAGWDLSGYLDPVVLRDETAVVARYGSQDLIAVDPGWTDGDPARIRWVAHPGGVIRALSTTGDLTVAATSERALVGYGPDGIRHWRLELPDLIAPPLATDGDLLYAASVNGWVTAVEPRSGRQHWRQRVGDHLLTGPAPVPSGGVVVGTAEGTLLRLAADGSVTWSEQLDDSRPAIESVATTGEQVFTVSGEVAARAVSDGSEQWAIDRGSAVPIDLATPTGLVGLATSYGVWALEPARGDTLWWLDQQVGAVRGRGGVLFSFSPGRVDAGLADRETRASWQLPGLNPNRGRCGCAATPDGWLFSTGTTLARLR